MNRSRLLFLLSLLNLVAVFVCIYFLPQTVVFKFNSDFIVDELVSKWCNIILPLIQVISCIILVVIDIKTSTIPHFYRYIVMYIAIAIAMFYTWIMIVIQFGGYHIGDRVSLPLSSLILISIGLFMPAYSYYQKGKRVGTFSIFGYGWVRKSPIVWKKTHFAASVNGAFCGLLIMACGIVNDIVFKSNWAYLVAFGFWFIIYYMSTFFHSIRVYKHYY